MWGAQCLLEVRRRFWGGSGRPSMLMLVRSAAALATMRPVLLLRDFPGWGAAALATMIVTVYFFFQTEHLKEHQENTARRQIHGVGEDQVAELVTENDSPCLTGGVGCSKLLKDVIPHTQYRCREF